MDSEETDMTSKTKFLRFSPVIMVTLVFMVISLGSRVVDGQTDQSRQMRPVSVIGDLIDISKANDERNYTRAMAGRRSTDIAITCVPSIRFITRAIFVAPWRAAVCEAA